MAVSFCWGPLWDSDFAWNNNGMWKASNQHFNNTTMLWIDTLRDKDPQFVTLLQERWNLLNGYLEELTRENGIMDQYKEEVRESQHADYLIWHGQEMTYDVTEDYDATIDTLKSWINARRTWAEANIADIGKSFYTVSYQANGEVVAEERVRYEQNAAMNPDAPAPEGKVFSRWMCGDRPLDKVKIKEDRVAIAEYVDESEAVAPESFELDFPVEGITVELDTGFFPVIELEGDTLDNHAWVEPYDEVTNPRIHWTSSNERVATIDMVSKRVVLKAGGDTTITGTLYNGASAFFVLHVNGPEPEPDTISIQDAKVVLSATALTYNKKVQKPSIKTVGGKTLAQPKRLTKTTKPQTP